MTQLKVLDLFSGIGGFSLGLERTGYFKTIMFCEIDNYCQRVLHKHWPEIPIHDDIRTLTAKQFEGYERPDVICGGFPCQDISQSGLQLGIDDGLRSGLWREMLRLVCELRPKFLFVENVAALLSNGMGRVLGDLAESGYDAEWDCIPASALGAPHERDRTWIVGYPISVNYPGKIISGIPDKTWTETRLGELVRVHGTAFRDEAFSTLGGMDDGLPNRLDRLHAIGNAVIPQIPEWIGYRIAEAERLTQ